MNCRFAFLLILSLTSTFEVAAEGPFGSGALNNHFLSECVNTCTSETFAGGIKPGRAQCLTYCMCASDVDRRNPHKWDGGEQVLPLGSRLSYQQQYCANVQWPESFLMPPPLPGEKAPGPRPIRLSEAEVRYGQRANECLKRAVAEGLSGEYSAQYTKTCQNGDVSEAQLQQIKSVPPTPSPLCKSLAEGIEKLRIANQRGAANMLKAREEMYAQRCATGK